MLSNKKKSYTIFFAIRVRFVILFFFTLIINNSKGYTQNSHTPDSLKDKSYKELFELESLNNEDSLKVRYYINIYLSKAKHEKDTIRIANAYTQFASSYNSLISLKYCDSIINLTLKLKNKEYPGFGYMTKGMVYFKLGNDQKALDNYLTAHKYASKHNNIAQLLYIESLIGKLKNFIGKNEEALISFKNILRRLDKKKNRDLDYYDQIYFRALFSLSNSFILEKEYDSALAYTKIGIKKSITNKDSLNYYSFVSQSGYIAYYQNNFKAAIDSLNKALPYETSSNGLLNDHYYRGKINYELKKPNKAFYHFKKADSIYNSTNDAVSEVREIQEFFVSHYRKNKNLKTELFYINRLLKVDSVLTSTNHYLNENITKKYDVPNLIFEKEKIINSLKNKERNSNFLISSLFILIVLSIPVVFMFYKKQKVYKKQLSQINSIKNVKKTNSNLSGVSPKIIDNVLSQLNDFEKENGFLENKLTLNILSKNLNTNSNYLSKIINHHKKMNFSSYISNLRIDYCIEKLKTDEKFRKFTVNGIAFEIGFNNVESFSKAFHKKTNTYPSYFIKEIEEKNII